MGCLFELEVNCPNPSFLFTSFFSFTSQLLNIEMGLQFRGSWEEPASQGQATSHQDVDLGHLRGAPAFPLKGPFPVGSLAPGPVRERHTALMSDINSVGTPSKAHTSNNWMSSMERKDVSLVHSSLSTQASLSRASAQRRKRKLHPLKTFPLKEWERPGSATKTQMCS